MLLLVFELSISLKLYGNNYNSDKIVLRYNPYSKKLAIENYYMELNSTFISNKFDEKRRVHTEEYRLNVSN